MSAGLPDLLADLTKLRDTIQAQQYMFQHSRIEYYDGRADEMEDTVKALTTLIKKYQ